jgi:hypothetical protein
VAFKTLKSTVPGHFTTLWKSRSTSTLSGQLAQDAAEYYYSARAESVNRSVLWVFLTFSRISSNKSPLFTKMAFMLIHLLDTSTLFLYLDVIHLSCSGESVYKRKVFLFMLEIFLFLLTLYLHLMLMYQFYHLHCYPNLPPKPSQATETVG